jgi:hypothetical protein
MTRRATVIAGEATGAAVLALAFLVLARLDIAVSKWPGMGLIAGAALLAALAAWMVARHIKQSS